MYEKFKSIYSYNPETGLFIRITDGGRKDRRIGQIVGSFDTSTGYIRIGITGKVCLAHRLAWYYVYGEYPEQIVDHINGIKTDNRIANLRLVSILESSKNMPFRCDNTTGHTGITFTKGKYWARIHHENRSISLGRFSTLQEAIKVRKEAEVRYGYHTNHGRDSISLIDNFNHNMKVCALG